jgi:hypothetical protein
MRRTRLRKLLDSPFTCFGKGNNGVEVDIEQKFATVMAILQDRACDILLSRIVFENFETEGSRAKDTIVSVVVEVHDIQNERLMKRTDEQEFGFRPCRIVTENVSV